KEFKLLEEEIADSLIQGLQLGDEADVEWIKVAPYLLPNDVVEDLRPENDDLQVYFEKVLPIGYVENRKKSNQEVVHQVMASIYVSDDIVLEEYDLDSFELQGVDILYLRIENAHEEVIYRKDDYTMNHPIIPKVEYSCFEELNNEAYSLRAATYRRIQTIDEEGNEIDQQEEYDIHDYILNVSDEGFEVSVPDRALKGKYSVICADLAKEGITYDQQRLAFVKRVDGRLWLQGEERLYLPNYYSDPHDYTITVFGYSSAHSFTED
ncbi:MAG: hypothetical protein HUJ56_06035, partial [Erysipelotrichaceae bacterium]|nr:hypothetical protein [Erysipelotrichaceae bacterium]